MGDFSDIEDIEAQIDAFDRKIEDTKKASDKAKGAIDTYMKQSKTEYNLSSKDEMLDFIKEGKQELIKISNEIKSDFNVLMEKCGDEF